MSKTSGNVVNPLDLVDDVRRRRVPLLRARRDARTASDGDFTLRGPVGRYNGDLANNLGNLLAARRHRRRQEVRRHRPGARAPTSPLADAAAAAFDGARRGVGRRRSRASALEATWSLIRATNALPRGQRAVEGRARPRGRRRAWATRSRRCASSPILASPALPDTCADVWERIGLTGRRRRPAPARRRRVGRLPRRRSPSPRATPLFPRKSTG